MKEISAALVKELRDATNVGMMECKRALVEANGDKAGAMKILRERGLAVAAQKSSRAANSGMVAAAVTEDIRVGGVVEINCETDFVAKNAGFQAFAQALAERSAREPGDLTALAKSDVTAKIAEIGENIVLRRSLRYEASGPGGVFAYVHHGNTIVVLMECGCAKPETAGNEVFRALAKDLCLHVAASSPRYIDRSHVPPDVLAAEREIYAKQVQNKPPAIVEKIVDGKIAKFYEQVCLVDQIYFRDQETPIRKLIENKSKEIGDTFVIRRFARLQVGERLD